MTQRARTRGLEGHLHLTFDDGPDGQNTTAVLDALRHAGARATFFVTAGRAPDTVRAIAHEGHGIAYHCRRHRRHSQRTRTAVHEELEMDMAWLDAIGVRPRGWRTPWGDLAGWTFEVAAQHGLEVWGWSHDTQDWSGRTTQEMIDDFGETIQEGAVVLMHDGIGPGARRSDVDSTAALIAPLCAMAARQGLRVGPLP